MPTHSIILNGSNKVGNNLHQLEYEFPSSLRLDEAEISLQSATFYNSFNNVTAAYGNNSITFNWPSLIPEIKQISFVDGFYSIESLSEYIHYSNIIHKHYCLSSDGEFVYFIKLMSNSTTYSADAVFYELPTAAEATALGYTKPEGATWDFPAASTTPSITISSSFGNLIGFNPGVFPSTTGDTISVSSSKTPKINITQSIICGCNLANNLFSNSIAIASIPLNAAFGGLVSWTNQNEDNKIPVSPSTYTKLVLTFMNQDYDYANLLKDSDVVFVLSLTIPAAKKGEDKK